MGTRASLGPLPPTLPISHSFIIYDKCYLLARLDLPTGSYLPIQDRRETVEG